VAVRMCNALGAHHLGDIHHLEVQGRSWWLTTESPLLALAFEVVALVLELPQVAI